MVTYISVLSRSNIARAHVSINSFIYIVVNHFIEYRSNLVYIENATIILKIGPLPFSLPKTGTVGMLEYGRVKLNCICLTKLNNLRRESLMLLPPYLKSYRKFFSTRL